MWVKTTILCQVGKYGLYVANTSWELLGLRNMTEYAPKLFAIWILEYSQTEAVLTCQIKFLFLFIQVQADLNAT